MVSQSGKKKSLKIIKGCNEFAVGPPIGRDGKLVCPCSQEICFDCRHEFHGS